MSRGLSPRVQPLVNGLGLLFVCSLALLRGPLSSAVAAETSFDRQAQPLTLEAYLAAPVHEQYALLQALATGQSVVASGDDLENLIRNALAAKDPKLRAAALSVLGSRLRASSLPNAEDIKVIGELSRRALAMASDPDENVRMCALRLVIALEYRTLRSAGLSRTATARLVDAYEKERSATIRASLIRLIVRSQPQGGLRAEVRQLIRQAGASHDEAVLVATYKVIGERRYIAGAGILSEGLQHRSTTVRSVAAAAFVALGRVAVVYLPQMRTALAREPDAVTRRILDETIHSLESVQKLSAGR